VLGEYMILIPGGIDGLNDGNGFYIPNDISVLLEVTRYENQ
jgi:hypothetical protein